MRTWACVRRALLSQLGLWARNPFPLDEAMPIIQQLIDGIEAAHEKNIVHRDLKPSNIKITLEGMVKILDFVAVHSCVYFRIVRGRPRLTFSAAAKTRTSGNLLASKAPTSTAGKKGGVSNGTDTIHRADRDNSLRTRFAYVLIKATVVVAVPVANLRSARDGTAFY
jgi:serine/threonine protein kinase